MNILLRILFIASLSPCLNAQVELEPYIVNGSQANINQYPSFATVFFDNGTSVQTICGAAVIDAQHVLTAAHCIYQDRQLMQNLTVAFQLADERDYQNAEVVRGDVFYYPDSFVDSSAQLWPDDIAIIKLETPLNTAINGELLNFTLNDTYPSNLARNSFVAIGHGLENNNGLDNSLLQQVSLVRVAGELCRGSSTSVSDQQLCFDGAFDGVDKGAICNGDSGGPLYWWNGNQYIQIGIASFGPSDCGDKDVNFTSVFTEVYDYQNWIRSVLEQRTSPQYLIEIVDGERTLVEYSGTNGSSSGGSSGGSINMFAFTSLILLALYRVRKYRG